MNDMRVSVATTSLLTLFACGYRSRERSITSADVANDRTRLTNFMSAPLRPGSPSEQAPGSISRSVLVDEARVTRLNETGVCVAVHVRTHTSLDVPLSEHDVTLNGSRRAVDNEQIAYADYLYTGERERFNASFISREAFAGLRVSEPEARVFRVMERKGEICGPPTREREIQLKLELPQDDLRGSWGENFVWTLDN